MEKSDSVESRITIDESDCETVRMNKHIAFRHGADGVALVNLDTVGPYVAIRAATREELQRARETFLSMLDL